jgi:hypothetical protein
MTWGTGSSVRTWSLSLPDISAPAQSLPVLAGVSQPTPATVKRALSLLKPVLVAGRVNSIPRWFISRKKMP